MGKVEEFSSRYRVPIEDLEFVVFEKEEFEELVDQIGRQKDVTVVRRFRQASFLMRFPKVTIEQHLAASIGLASVEYSEDDRRTIARGLFDLIVLGSCHLIKKLKGIKRLDPAHVKIKLD